MKFSEALEEYLQLREDEATRDYSWTPIARRRDGRDRMDELLAHMNQLVAAPKGEAGEMEAAKGDRNA